jgi:hypothetical protein
VVDRVVEDVLEGRAVLLFGLDGSRPEAAAEDVTLTAVSLIEGTCVLPVQVAHPFRQIREWGLDEQVVVVAEETSRVQLPAVAPADASQDPDEDRAVSIVQEDGRVVVALRADVVARTGFSVAERSPHAATVPASNSRVRLRAPLVTLALHPRHVPGT